ncbi:MAG: ABC transporter permease [Rikenellaceae bacterium]|nr:ABC transporter permease [Rikenellaceae bacterium]
MFENTARVLIRECRRILRYPVYLTLMVILPTISFAFFAVLFSEGVATDIPIAVVDMDKTPTSRTLVSMINDTPSAIVAYGAADMAEGERMVREGKVLGVVYVPPYFEKDIMSNTRTGVAVYISGLNITANGLLGKDIQTAVTTFSSGIQLQVLMKNGLSEKEAMAQVLPVYFDRHILFNPYVNYGYYLLPSFLPMMLMIFSVMLTIFAIGSELKNYTAGEWFAVAGGNTGAALFGKMIPYTISMFFMALLMNTIMYKWIGVPLNGNIFALTVGAFLLILAYQSIAVLIVTVLANLRMSLSIGGGYSVLAFTFSGLTFPRMAMSPLLQKLSYIFPFTFYTDIFIDQAMRGAPVIYSLGYMGWLTLFILLPMLCLPRLKKIASHSEYWGKL